MGSFYSFCYKICNLKNDGERGSGRWEREKNRKKSNSDRKREKGRKVMEGNKCDRDEKKL